MQNPLVFLIRQRSSYHIGKERSRAGDKADVNQHHSGADGQIQLRIVANYWQYLIAVRYHFSHNKQ
jgi:hypothetical protein